MSLLLDHATLYHTLVDPVRRGGVFSLHSVDCGPQPIEIEVAIDQIAGWSVKNFAPS
jgi:hypothetical protein